MQQTFARTKTYTRSQSNRLVSRTKMRSIRDLNKRIIRTISLLDLAFGLLVVWMAYFYALIRKWHVVQVGEHVLQSDSEWGHLAQTVTGLVVSLVADRYGRSAAILCRRFMHLTLTIASVRFEARTQYGRDSEAQPFSDSAASYPSPSPRFQLSVNIPNSN